MTITTHPEDDRLAITSFVVAKAARGLDPRAFSASAPTWYPAVVPGGVHESLLAAGVIDNPYVDTNEAAVRWIEECDWWYRAEFGNVDAKPGERLRLVFHGLDTVVTIWLNGHELGRHENQFRPAEFDVTELVSAHNEILLRFTPPLAGRSIPASASAMSAALAKLTGSEALSSNDSGPLSATVAMATTLRKATFSWGWDFAPRVPSIGVWRPVELIHETPASIVGHHVAVSQLRDGEADVALLVQTRAAVDGLIARVTLTSPSGRRSVYEFPFEGDAAGAVVRLVQPELWWTHDMGAPNLYDVVIETVSEGAVITSHTDRIGLRTIEIDRQDDVEGGRLFRFVLNGVPLFARGACWTPADMLVGSVSAEKYRDLITLARDGNMNMLRIWGGGVYENDPFYELTDELGILVWQDFMFACTDYPSLDEALQYEVDLEARYQVRRLRNRCSIGLWCGNNEVQAIHGAIFGNVEPGNWGWDFFHRILPEAVQAEDGRVPYWPGSPYGEDASEGPMAINGVRDGDRHAWEVWHGGDMGAGGKQFASIGESRLYRRYADDAGKFISEFGIHASPELSTLRRWIRRDLEIHSESFDAHNKDNPKDKHDAVLEIVTGLPTTVAEYVEYTMVSQAEGLKFGIEHYRRRQPHCSGTLVWQLNDAWPGFSWSVIDYDLVPKAGYYYVSRAFAPVLASFKGTGEGAELWITNSSRDSVRATARVSRVGLDGRATAVTELPVDLGPGDSLSFWAGAASADEILWVDSADGAFPSNRYFGAEVKNMAFAEHSLATSVTASEAGAAEIEIQSRGYNYFVHVPSPAPGIRFSDNYFDLRDGEKKTITVTGLADVLDPAQLVATPFIGAH
jgi:beta-mannosidase